MIDMHTENFQWIWGVLSAFSKDISKDDVLKYPLPFADGYTGFWKNPLTLQHPLAEIEITAWDGCFVLFISKDNKQVDLLQESFPFAQDLERYNAELG